ncbi:carbohydrate deacetylase [Cytophaga aurantiaca]|uniref:carbohydrate deacetylase n=1 Tax=Cytophaga aurantiaca TaxID=29530 RepID=UPI000367E441|nr:ChbG/HpnK family deacetylase [Cytophaga aurantiaca]
MPKKLILNADDFGWDNDATNAIIELVGLGKIHNTTVLANHVQSVDLIRLKNTGASISIGLHTCLNEGKSLRSTPSSLTDEHCNFYSSKDLFIKCLRKEILYEDVLHEIKLQHNFLLEHGIAVTHADSHQHIHQYPFLGNLITKALAEVGIARIRNCNPYSVYDLRRVIIKTFCLLTAKNIDAFKHPDVLITDFTNTTISFQDRVPEILKSIASSSHHTIEWMCHPGFENRSTSYLQRKAEYNFLKNADWEDLLKQLPIQLSQYKEL